MREHSDTRDTRDALAHGEWFRVRVCLEHFFSDERRRALVAVPAQRPARWLLRRLRDLFALPPAPRLALLAHGHLLPRREPLALLSPDDTVTVVPAGMTGDGNVPGATDGVSKTTNGADEPDATFDRRPTTRPSESAPSPPPRRDHDALDELTASKRRALQLLERYHVAPAEGPPAPAEAPGPSPPAGDLCPSPSPEAPRPPPPAAAPDIRAPQGRAAPRRRRVRRRRRVTPLPLDAADEDGTTEPLPRPVERQPCIARVCRVDRADASAATWRTPEHDVPRVLRCGGSARSPRRVPALPVPPPGRAEGPTLGCPEEPPAGPLPGAPVLAPFDLQPDELNLVRLCE